MDVISYRARCKQISGEYETYMKHVVFDDEGNIIGHFGPSKECPGTGPYYHIGAYSPPPEERKPTENSQ
jgi:hypothetical protein